jgi:hypothetical protein
MSVNTSPTTTPPTPSTPPTARNPATTARFRRESWWQIIFPVVLVGTISLGVVVFLGIMAFAGEPGSELPASVVADFTLILLILLALVGGLILLALVIAVWYGVTYVVRAIPPYTFVAQQSVDKVYQATNNVSNKIAGVIISIRGFFLGIKLFLENQGWLPAQESPNGSSPADNGSQAKTDSTS